MSVNNKLMLEPYTGKNKIEGHVVTGFATIKQKTTLVGLKLIADGKVSVGKDMIDVKKGQMVYFTEEILHASEWSKKVYSFEDIEIKFILGESIHAVAVK